MSKVTIAGDVNGTGVFTIAAPNGNTNRTLVLPDNAGTVLTSASSIVAGNLIGALPAINGSALTGNIGKVLQVTAFTLSTREVLPLSAEYWGSFGTINKISATSTLVVSGTFSGYGNYSGTCGVGIRINTLYRYGNYTYGQTSHGKNYAINASFEGMPVGAHIVYWGWKVFNGSAGEKPFNVFNPNNADDTRGQQSTSVIVVMEVEA
jgi:hypothetical protein